MTKQQMQRKLNQLKKIANELNAAAKERYGKDASLFYESEGFFFILAGDCDGSASERQKFIRASSQGNCWMGCGAW